MDERGKYASNGLVEISSWTEPSCGLMNVGVSLRSVKEGLRVRGWRQVDMLAEVNRGV